MAKIVKAWLDVTRLRDNEKLASLDLNYLMPVFNGNIALADGWEIELKTYALRKTCDDLNVPMDSVQAHIKYYKPIQQGID
jgi:hypothetical protein